MRAVETLKTYSHVKLIKTVRYLYFPLGFVLFLTLKVSQAVKILKALFQTAASAFETRSQSTGGAGS